MNIQEFSRQLGREEHPSQLIQALQTLRGLDTNQIRWAGDWIPWGEDEPRAYAERPELRS